ncbi:MAG TPA: FAD:protein FMN transferase [Humisphaera sp.]|nr:FAD:protein FMN transferase [Humisphaera sp.]
MRFTLVFVVLFATRAAMAETLTLRGVAQGTTYHIKFVMPAKKVDSKQLQAELDRYLAEIDREMSTYRTDSEISEFNRAPANEWFAASKAMVEVVVAAREVSEKSFGAEDITVNPLVRLWHFGAMSGGAGKPSAFTPPSDERIAAARKLVGYKLVDSRLDPPALRKRKEGVEIDLSSICSGYTIDHLSEIIMSNGVSDFVVELGGECRAGGKREEGTPWRIAVERPILAEQRLETAVPLVNAALATAGGNQHFWEYQGKRYSHIIDPATGKPIEHALTSVTVAADTCLEADGWDTPLVVLGPQRGFDCAEANGLAALFISHSDADAAGKTEDAVRATPAWRKRFGDAAR